MAFEPRSRKPRRIGLDRSAPLLLAVACLAVLGCQSAGGTAKPECLPVSVSGQSILGLTWVNGGQRLIVLSVVGPFDPATPGAANFTEVEWPGRQQRLLYTAPRAHGGLVGSDGSLYWLENDGIWQLAPATTEPVHRVTIEEAKSVVQFWAVSDHSLLVMRRDHGNAVEEFRQGTDAATERLPADEDAQKVWPTADGETLVITDASLTRPTAWFVVHRADGSSSTVDSGIGLPVMQWLSHDQQRIVFQDFNESAYVARVDNSTAPTVLDAIPTGVDAMSDPSPDGIVAYAGGGSGPGMVCFAAVPAELLP